jgi:hypothetical protein
MGDAELTEFVSEFREGILDGTTSFMACGMVCHPLVTLLNMAGVPCSIQTTLSIRTSYGSVNHVWIALADGRVIDPTADQFNDEGFSFPPVYLGKKIRKLHRAAKPLTRSKSGDA